MRRAEQAIAGGQRTHLLRSIARREDGSIEREVDDIVALETPTTAAIGPSAAEARSTPLSDL